MCDLYVTRVRPAFDLCATCGPGWAVRPQHVETIHALHAEVRGLLRKQEKAEDLHRKELGFKDRLLHQ